MLSNAYGRGASNVCRVVSLLPSATELLSVVVRKAENTPTSDVAADAARTTTRVPPVELVGRSHECDQPQSFVEGVPMLTASSLFESYPSAAEEIPSGEEVHCSKEIDTQVRQSLQQGKSLYHLDQNTLKNLAPDVILTQSLCGVCSVETVQVMEAVERMEKDVSPHVVNLNPTTLEQILDDLVTVGDAVGLKRAAEGAQRELTRRIQQVKQMARERSTQHIPKVAFLEWTDPLFVGGHWTPQLIHMAGGCHPLNEEVGSKSFVVQPDDVVKMNPDLIVVAPCGYNLAQTREAVRTDLESQSWWKSIQAVKEGNVVLVDGNLHFNRPSTRLIESLEWLGWLFERLNENDGLYSGVETMFSQEYQWEVHVPSNSIKDASKSKKASRRALKEQSGNGELPVEIEEAHHQAMKEGKIMYEDPFTGLFVFTELASLERGYCCGRKCRHCPYGHVNVPAEKRTNRLKEPTLLNTSKGKKICSTRSETRDCTVDVLFWSGGKDSLLALKWLQSEYAKDGNGRKVVLLTTFDDSSQRIPEQNIPIHSVFDQAQALQVDLMAVPLPSMCPNDSYVSAVEGAIERIEQAYGVSRYSSRLIFGDLHLEDIKEWRRGSFPRYETHFPIFGKSYEELKDRLFTQDDSTNDQLEIRISKVESRALKEADIQVGDAFTPELLSKLEKLSGVDSFGELGEFHTSVQLK
eukprot:gb/GECG01000091.1/.p1 GENE.gb/GECG01000091.1/~~gb/GECG01000091.1/.p1  ORF type:complete len:693 (+),score=94.86 gb/GECG01000091.1/:1-2079(+)